VVKLDADLVGRGDWIRTSDLLNPIQVRYQAALRPDEKASLRICFDHLTPGSGVCIFC
jgi:hypothetical protein